MLGPPNLPTQAKSQASLPASWGPQTQGLNIGSYSDLGLLDSGHSWGRAHPACLGPAAIYKPKPGEVKWWRRGSRPPAPTPTPSPAVPSPSPHGFLFPSPHNSPASRGLASFVSTTCKHLLVTPKPHSHWPEGPLLLLTPPGPRWSGVLRAAPPSRTQLPRAAPGTFPHFSVPLALGRAPTPMAATMLAVRPPEAGFSGRPYPPQEPGSLGASGTLWAPGDLGGHPSGQGDPAVTLLVLSFPLTLWAGRGTIPHAVQSRLDWDRWTGPEATAQPT